MYGRTQKYGSFWSEQERLWNQILNDQAALNRGQVSELDRYKQGEIDRVKQEVKEYERTHGHGGFMKDFAYGITKSNDMLLKPFLKYAAPVVSQLGPVGKGIAMGAGAVSGVVDKLS